MSKNIYERVEKLEEITELNVANLLSNDWVVHNDTGNQIFKQGNIVHIQLCVRDGSERIIMRLPSGYRPNKLTYLPCTSNRLDATNYVGISNIGDISVPNDLVGKLLFINVSYKVD